ncbi:MAG: hypothetical protein KF684_11635 [Phycisphaeraceae bacterium]|nr:hypothetical protein [Phycisphaeraceae bacterium]
MRTACVLSAIISVTVCAAPAGRPDLRGFIPQRAETLFITLPTAIDAPHHDALADGRSMLALLCIDLDALLAPRDADRAPLLTDARTPDRALTFTLDL